MKIAFILLLIVSNLSLVQADDACSPSAEGIDLENEYICKGCSKKGAFFGIPRDYQDGVGTCFANVAKYLLISVSGGKYVSSYMDLAAVNKTANYEFRKYGIAGGDTCNILNDVTEFGFCPVKYSSVENRQANPVLEGLQQKNGSISKQAYTIKMLQKFLTGDDLLKAEKSADAAYVRQNLKSIINKFIAKPEVKFPLPVLRFALPGESEMKYGHYSNNKDDPTKIDARKVETFILEYRKEYKQFLPKYADLVMKGKKVDDIIAEYKIQFTPFYQKYQMDNKKTWDRQIKLYKQGVKIRWDEENQENIYDSPEQELASPTLNVEIRNTLNFMRAINPNYKTDEESIVGIAELEKPLMAVKELADELRRLNKEADILYKDDKLLKDHDLTLLAIAPGCMNPANRVKPDFKYSCRKDYEVIKRIDAAPLAGKKAILRETIYSSLKNGLAVGRTFPFSGGLHINTIVGMKLDSETDACMMKVRDSATGTSEWFTDEQILTGLEDLTITKIN